MGIGAGDWPGMGPYPFPRISGRAITQFPSGQPGNKPAAVVNGARGLLGAVNAAAGNVSPFVGTPISSVPPSGSNVKGALAHSREGSGSISGHVYDTNSNPVSGATVRIYDDVSGILLGTTSSAVDGSFSLAARGYTQVLAVCEQVGLNAQVFDRITPV